MPKYTNWNTRQYREWEQSYTRLSIDPSYIGKDPFNFKAGSQHFHKKIRRIG